MRLLIIRWAAPIFRPFFIGGTVFRFPHCPEQTRDSGRVLVRGDHAAMLVRVQRFAQIGRPEKCELYTAVIRECDVQHCVAATDEKTGRVSTGDSKLYIGGIGRNGGGAGSLETTRRTVSTVSSLRD